MNILVLNYSGSVGKTTIAAHVLFPRMQPGAVFFAVESTNESAVDLGLEAEQMRGNRFHDLFKQLLLVDDAVVDVGASNIEDFLAELIRYDNAHEMFDFFVLPVLSSGKAQRETIRTVSALLAIGIDPSKIRILFNRVGKDVTQEFAPIFGYASQGTCIANPDARIEESKVFDMLANRRTTITEVLADQTDYRKLMRENRAGDPAVLDTYIDQFTLQSLCKPVNRQLDRAFQAVIS
jgi:hypothetical protein